MGVLPFFVYMYAGHPQKGREAALRGSMRAQRMSCDGDIFTIRRDDGYPAAMLHRVHLFLAGLALSALTVSLAPLPVLAVEKGKAVQAPAGKAKEAEREAEEKSRLGMTIRRDDSVWRAELPSSEARPDELRPLERRHVVRAYADFMDSDDASLTIGPELMLKDEHNEWGKKSRPEENDPSVGLGMQFSLDF